MAVIVDGASTDREHGHGGCPVSETRARLFAFFPFSALTIHPCLNAAFVDPIHHYIPQNEQVMAKNHEYGKLWQHVRLMPQVLQKLVAQVLKQPPEIIALTKMAWENEAPY